MSKRAQNRKESKNDIRCPFYTRQTSKNGYMNELDPHTSNSKDYRAQKDFKELKVINYTNIMYLPFRWLNHRNSKIVFCLKQFHVGRSFENFYKKHVSENKTCWNNCVDLWRWSYCRGCKGMLEPPGVEFKF